MASKKQFVLVFASEENGYESNTQEFETEQELKSAVDNYFAEQAELGKDDDWEEDYGDYKNDIINEYDESRSGYQEFADARGYVVFLGIAKREHKSVLDEYVADLQTEFEEEYGD